MTKPSQADDIRNAIVISLLLAAITIAAFWGVLGNKFITYDDNGYIFENPHVQMGINARTVIWAFNVGYCYNWHPLTWVSHMADCALFDLNPAGHHAMSLLFHVLSTILLFLALRRLTKSTWKSAFVAALFAVHPLHVESVAWAAERKDVLSTVFWMLTMGAYAFYAERPSFRRYVPVLIFLGLGLMAKPMLVTLPFVLLLLDYWPLRRKERTVSLAVEKLPLISLAAVSAVLTFLAQSQGRAVRSLQRIPLAVRLENAVVSYVEYIIKMVYPRGLAVLYPHPMHLLPAWQVGGALLVLIAVTFFAVRTRPRRPYVFCGWFWYLGTLLPVIGLVQVGEQAMADRYTYIPLVGLFIALAWGIPDLLSSMGVCQSKEHRRAILSGSACIVIAVLALLTRIQVGYWRDNLTLFRHVVDCTENNYVMHNSLGLALSDAGRVDEAIAQYKKALEIMPDYVSARLDLGIALGDHGHLDEAIQHFRLAITYDPRVADSYFDLGRALERKGDMQGATEQYLRALERNPNHAEAHVSMGNSFSLRGYQDEAIAHYRQALDINPLSVEGHTDLANALFKKGDKDDAIREYREAVRLKPDFAVAHSNLAVVLFTRGEYAEAWKEVDLAQVYGSPPAPAFVAALSQKMPKPQP